MDSDIVFKALSYIEGGGHICDKVSKVATHVPLATLLFISFESFITCHVRKFIGMFVCILKCRPKVEAKQTFSLVVLY